MLHEDLWRKIDIQILGERAMNMFARMNDLVMYLFAGIGQIFSVERETYPDIGVQPFTGEVLSEWLEF